MFPVQVHFSLTFKNDTGRQPDKTAKKQHISLALSVVITIIFSGHVM